MLGTWLRGVNLARSGLGCCDAALREAVPDDFERLLGFFALGLGLLAAHGGEAVEQQLRQIGQSYGIAALDALAYKLLGEIAEKLIDAGGGAEILDGGKQLGSQNVVGRRGSGKALRVVGAEFAVGRGEHAAAVAPGIEVLAEGGLGGFGVAWGGLRGRS
jgi:hypothetical protein